MSENESVGIDFEANPDQTLDLNSVDESSFESLPKGRYPVTIEEAEYKLSQSSQQPMWALKLNVDDGEFAGRKLFANMSFSPKALPMTKKFILRFLPDLASSPFNPANQEVVGRLQGMKATAKVDIQKGGDYAGNNQVKELLPEGAAV